jgi:Antitoxin SocA-like, Panacea domain
MNEMAVQTAKRRKPMRFDKEKFKSLVLYVIWRGGRGEGFGLAKLNKIMWLSDARAYMLRGRPITGATYIRERQGPGAEKISSILRDLERDGLIEPQKAPGRRHRTGTFRVADRPDLSLFGPEELSIVDYWIEHIDADRADPDNGESSQDYTWQIAEVGEVIPYYAVLATRIRAPRGKELAWAKAEAKRLGLE